MKIEAECERVVIFEPGSREQLRRQCTDARRVSKKLRSIGMWASADLLDDLVHSMLLIVDTPEEGKGVVFGPGEES